MGAKPDHWIGDEYGFFYNVIMSIYSPFNKDTEDALQKMHELSKLFFEKFSKFGIADRGIEESPLGRSISWEMNIMSKTIIESKAPINPISSFLSWSIKQSAEEKIENLKTIDEFYNLSNVIQSDLEQISKDGKFNDSTVRTNLQVLFDFCRSKGNDYLLKVFGKSYSITGPLGWRFKKGNHFKWVAQEMVNRNFKNGKCFIQHNRWEIMGNEFKVYFKYIYVRNMFSLFDSLLANNGA